MDLGNLGLAVEAAFRGFCDMELVEEEELVPGGGFGGEGRGARRHGEGRGARRHGEGRVAENHERENEAERWSGSRGCGSGMGRELEGEV
jgi:hypothetical protein